MSSVPMWSPPVEMSAAEHKLLRFCKKAPLFAFLRRTRHALLDDEFQRELASMYATSPRGRPPVAPALLAMATVLQSALGVSDQEAARLAVTDRCWQMVLGTLESEEGDEAPFSQGALFDFRMRLITHGKDRRLLERTVHWARQSKQYSSRALRAAFDVSGLWGCGRVEDTFNLIGHAVRELVDSVAERLGLSSEDEARRAGIELVVGTSLKAMLDIDWDDADASARAEALQKLLSQVEALQAFVRAELAEPPFEQQLATLSQVITQDLEPDPGGGGRQRIKRGVARERRISITDSQMRHGRKSKNKLINGCKRLQAARGHGSRCEPDRGRGSVARQPSRGRVGQGPVRRHRAAGLERRASAHRSRLLVRRRGAAPVRRRHAGALPSLPSTQSGWALHEGGLRARLHDADAHVPCGQTAPLRLGEPARFAAAVCQPCPQKEQCTASKRGRTVTIHAHEPMLVELRARQKTAEGRAALRRRVVVEHSLAGVDRTQGDRARYKGVRKNLFDVRRHAAVQNIYEVMNLAA